MSGRCCFYLSPDLLRGVARIPENVSLFEELTAIEGGTGHKIRKGLGFTDMLAGEQAAPQFLATVA